MKTLKDIEKSFDEKFPSDLRFNFTKIPDVKSFLRNAIRQAFDETRVEDWEHPNLDKFPKYIRDSLEDRKKIFNFALSLKYDKEKEFLKE